MRQGELEGMPEPAALRLLAADGQVLVTHGRTLVYRYEADDTGMRNLAIVALTDAGRRIDEVALLFGLTATYVSMLRGRARQGGSAALVRHRRGRPPKLTGRQVAQAQVWAASGWTQQAIADQLKVARSVISELLARVGPAPVQDVLTPTGNTDIESESPETVAGPDDTTAATSDIEPTAPEPAVTEPAAPEPAVTEPAVTEPVVTEPVVAGFTGTPVGSARATAGVYRCRYAGAMLLYPYLHQVGAEDVFATLTGAPARRYNDLAVLTTATVGFALGVDTVEGTKHLRRADAGAAVGLGVAPQLTTLRARLSALADGPDPLALQRAFAAGMLAADPAPDPVYFVDDHFVAYSGARPVAKGWNTKRRHAQPGRDDTLLVDARGRVGRGGVWCSSPWRPAGHRCRPRSGRRRSRPGRAPGQRPAFRRRRPAAAPTGRTRRPVRTTVPVASPAAGPHPVRPPRPRRPDANAWSPRRCRHPGRSPPSRWSTRPGRCSGVPARRSASRRRLQRPPGAGRGTAASRRRSGTGTRRPWPGPNQPASR